MAEKILDQARGVAEGQIDFEGQKLAEVLATTLLSTVAAVAFVVGFFLQDIKLALIVGLGGSALTFLLIAPPWPFFKRHPVNWLPVARSTMESQGIIVDGQLVG